MMNIILVSGKLSRARTITLSTSHLIAGTTGTLLGMLVLAFGLQYFMLRYAASFDSPLLNTLILSTQQEHNNKAQSYLRDILNAMASKLGQMQAQLLRPDTRVERFSQSAVFKRPRSVFVLSP